jgi:hypothetical protein
LPATRSPCLKARKGDRGFEGDDPSDGVACERDGKGAQRQNRMNTARCAPCDEASVESDAAERRESHENGHAQEEANQDLDRFQFLRQVWELR